MALPRRQVGTDVKQLRSDLMHCTVAEKLAVCDQTRGQGWQNFLRHLQLNTG